MSRADRRWGAGGRRENRGANSGPPISPDDLGQPQRRAGAGPETAQTWGGGDREPVPRGRESESKSQVCGFCAEATLRGQVGGGALSVALKTRRAGGKA